MSKFLDTYNERLERGMTAYDEKYKAMDYAVQAEKGILPEDISGMSSRETETANMFILPMLQIITQQLKKDISMRMPQYEIRGNNAMGEKVRNEFNQQMAQFLSFHNFGYKSKIGYGFGMLKGTIVERTRFRNISEAYALKDDGSAQDPLMVGGSVDFEYYDPQKVIIDPEASPFDVAKTAAWAIVTLGMYSREAIERTYNVTLEGKNVTGTQGGTAATFENDQRMIDQEVKAGKDDSQTERIVVRLYNIAETGMVYTIAGDSQIIASEMNDTGVIGRIFVNVCALDPDPESVFGKNYWEKIRWVVAMGSRAVNQVLDANDLNNSFPLVMLGGNTAKVVTIGSGDSQYKVLQIDDDSGKIFDIRQIIQKVQFPEVSNGAQLLLNLANQLISLITGVTPASMGVQSKQMRTSTEAGIYQQAIISNSSDLVLNIENSHINPVIWDILRVFRRHFEYFGFKEITPEALYNVKNIHVVNGSTLAVDKVSRQELLGYMLARASEQPLLWQNKEIQRFGLELMGGSEDRFLDLAGKNIENQQLLAAEAQRRAQIAAGGQQ